MNNSMLEKVDLWIDEHRDDIVKDIIRLVNIRSVSVPADGDAPFGEGCKKVLEEFIKLGNERGFAAHNYDYRIASLSLVDEAASNDIGLWGHLDVVPEGGDWEYEPYNAIEKNGFIIGRGSEDNKGSVIAAMYVLLCLKELDITLKHNVRVFAGCDEENGMADIEYFTSRYECPKMSIIPDAGFPVCYGEKGILEVSIDSKCETEEPLLSMFGGRASNMVPDSATAVLTDSPEVMKKLSELPETFTISKENEKIVLHSAGISKHTAFPTGGVNAIYLLTKELAERELLSEELCKVLELYNIINYDFFGIEAGIACEDDVSGKLTCVGSTLKCENGTLSLGLNIRYPVKVDSEAIKQTLAEISEKYGCVCKLTRDSKPNFFDPSNPIVSRFTEIYNSETGDDSKPYVMGGGTYARKLPNAFAFGLGMPNDSPADFLKPQHGGGHEPDEALSIDSLLKAMKIYARALIALNDYSL